MLIKISEFGWELENNKYLCGKDIQDYKVFTDWYKYFGKLYVTSWKQANSDNFKENLLIKEISEKYLMKERCMSLYNCVLFRLGPLTLSQPVRDYGKHFINN